MNGPWRIHANQSKGGWKLTRYTSDGVPMGAILGSFPTLTDVVDWAVRIYGDGVRVTAGGMSGTSNVYPTHRS